ncbi:MAG TPA: hypothetical protein VHV50_04100 [Actinomycetota bacterium]|nr:hypothetical protein [Actinomycetota bacterium]
MTAARPGAGPLRAVVAACLLVALAGCARDDAGPSRPGGSDHTPSARTSSPALPGYVEASIEVSPQPNFAVGAFGSLWVTVGNGTVVRVDPSTNKITATIRVGGKPGPIVMGYGALWVGDSNAGRLTRVDPHQERVAARIRLPGGVYGLTAGFGSVWASGVDWQGFARIDPQSNKVTARGHADGNDIAAGFGSLWLTGTSGVMRLSPHDLSVQSHVKTRTAVHSLAVGLGSVWGAAGDAGDDVFRIDPGRDAVAATIKTDQASFPDRIAFSRSTAWVGEFRAGAVLGIDPRRATIVRRFKAGDGSAVVTVAFGSLWVDNYYSNSVWRIPLP